MKASALVFMLGVALSAPADAGELRGPGRFCGYSPVIDLLAGEKVITLEGGIHGGSFRWQGAFGSLQVLGLGFAGRPAGRISRAPSNAKPARFAQRRTSEGYEIAIWNGGNGAAYFTSPKPFTAAQVHAIDRVALFEEGQEPTGCNLRTIFAWE